MGFLTVCSHRDSQVLNSVLVELTSRLRVIDAAVSAAEERRDRVLALARRLESEETDPDALRRLRSRRLSSVNATLERLCVLRQARKDLDFLCSGVARLCQDDENTCSGKVPLVAARLSAIGSCLGRLRPLPSPESEFDPETLMKEDLSEIGRRSRSRSKSRERYSRTSNRISREKATQARLRMCLDLSTQLYEKVLCRIPFVITDAAGRRVDMGREGEAFLENIRY